MAKSLHLILLSFCIVLNISDWITVVTCRDPRVHPSLLQSHHVAPELPVVTDRSNYNRRYLNSMLSQAANSLTRNVLGPRFDTQRNRGIPRGIPMDQQQLQRYLSHRLYQKMLQRRTKNALQQHLKRSDKPVAKSSPEQIGLRRRKGPDFNPTGW